VLKQRKYKEIAALLGPTSGAVVLDIGSDNGVISYLLRERGGMWKSADLDPLAVESIRELVGESVYQIDGGRTPFRDDEFDGVVIVDFLEHIPDDRRFVDELARIIKPGGFVILNVPHRKRSLLRLFRSAIGQTDEKHGHLRPGYTARELHALVGEHFTVEHHHTYSRFFSEFIDTLVVFAVSLLKRKANSHSQKGLLVTGKDMNAYKSMFRMYSLIYPIIWLVSKLDALLFFRSGYMLIAKARLQKR
jgi:SAM-dependent methyltransferase